MISNIYNAYKDRRALAYQGQISGENIIWNITAILVSGVWMIVGYYFTEDILYGNWLSPLTSIPGNIIQIVIGAIIGLSIAAALKRTKLFE